MCRESYSVTKFLCRHQEDGPTQITPLNGCGGCGVVKTKKPERAGDTTKRYPCDDCIGSEAWVKVNGAWTRK